MKGFEGNFECLGENTEKYITFSVPIKKKIENKDLEITYKIKFIDSYRFMASSLSKLVDNLSEGIHSNKCSDCGSNLDYIKIKTEKLILECYNCKQRYKKKFNKELIKRFASTYSFCNNDLNKFIILLRKESSYIQYLDANNLCSWEMSKKLSVNGFKWIDNNEINEDFIKNYDENNDKGYIFEVDVKYPKRLHELHSDLPFLPERMEINKCK